MDTEDSCYPFPATLIKVMLILGFYAILFIQGEKKKKRWDRKGTQDEECGMGVVRWKEYLSKRWREIMW